MRLNADMHHVGLIPHRGGAVVVRMWNQTKSVGQVALWHLCPPVLLTGPAKRRTLHAADRVDVLADNLPQRVDGRGGPRAAPGRESHHHRVARRAEYWSRGHGDSDGGGADRPGDPGDSAAVRPA